MNRFLLKTNDGRVIEKFEATDLTDAAMIALEKLGYTVSMHPNDAASKKAKKLLTLFKK